MADTTAFENSPLSGSWTPNTTSPKEKWAERNRRSKERQRKARERNAEKQENTGKRNIQDNGIDFVPRNVNPFQNAAVSGFTGTVAICINGTPYYIDIAYDDSIGPYSIPTGPNYEITEP